ncbi:uncharacterized protein LOC103722595 isoform X2 [Phoenix dactylifera]|uniref:DNA-directed RNA polymerase subunit n=1 Tax=Phoenix dactylifera TaxID=42345 RepID=A0A8B7MWU9_PHODC|nr:uncharacterized protein LOC103722595 isoform X2 [Phoenix dactylifera]
MEGLTVAEGDLMVYIHPSKAAKIRHAILRQLSSLLFTYDEVFEGVLLAYEVNIRSKRAKILPGLIPYFGVKLKANLLIFSPKPDMLLGKVVKLGKESIHVIVLGFSSAAIMLEDIREEFKHKIKHGAGVFASLSHKRHVIKVGSMIRFLVKSLDEEILHISGSLMPSQTGCIRWLSKHGAEDEPEINRSLKRQREREIKMEIEERDSKLNNEGDQSANFSRAHKSRKRTAAE